MLTPTLILAACALLLYAIAAHQLKHPPATDQTPNEALKEQSPIAPLNATEQRLIALGYELATQDGANREKEIALSMISMYRSTRKNTIAQCAEWLEVQGDRYGEEGEIALNEAAEQLRTKGMED